jgi:eukaryotic-like serine/threonine-protein kinase
VFEVCAAVKDGRAIGITVVSTPPSAQLNSCVRRAVAHLKFPQNSRMDVTHTRFDAARR